MAVDDTGKGFMRCSSMMIMMLSGRLPPGAWDFSGCLKSFSATRRIHFWSLSSVGCGISFPKLRKFAHLIQVSFRLKKSNLKLATVDLSHVEDGHAMVDPRHVLVLWNIRQGLRSLTLQEVSGAAKGTVVPQLEDDNKARK